MRQKNLTLNPTTRNPTKFPTSRMSELYKLSQNAQTYKLTSHRLTSEKPLFSKRVPTNLISSCLCLLYTSFGSSALLAAGGLFEICMSVNSPPTATTTAATTPSSYPTATWICIKV